MYDAIHGRRWDSEHPMWPRKPNGEPYKVISGGAKSVVESFRRGGQIELYPSVTTILGVTMGQYLVDWAGGLGVRAAIETKDGDGDWTERGTSRYKELRSEAADRGTDIHAIVEAWVKTKQVGPSAFDQSLIDGIRAAFQAHGGDALRAQSEWQFGRVPAGVAKSCGTPYGGTVDLLSDTILADLKTTNKERAPYLRECAQLVAYNWALPAPRKVLLNIYADQGTGKVFNVKAWSEQEQADGWEYFCHCCAIWKTETKWEV